MPLGVCSRNCIIPAHPLPPGRQTSPHHEEMGGGGRPGRGGGPPPPCLLHTNDYTLCFDKHQIEVVKHNARVFASYGRFYSRFDLSVLQSQCLEHWPL